MIIAFENETRRTIHTDTKIISIIIQCAGCPYFSITKPHRCNHKQLNKVIDNIRTIPDFCQLKTYNGE